MALKLVLIGLVAGLFSALFGVGGGIVIVPLLILLAGFESRVATGTSLAGIGITALGMCHRKIRITSDTMITSSVTVLFRFSIERWISSERS